MHYSYFAIASLPLAARYVSAHGWVNSWIIDGVERDGFVPSDPNRFPVSAERPTDNPKHGWAEPTDPIVACGGASPGENRETWDINGGSQITVNWISDDRIDPVMVWPEPHRGPVMEWMAECPSGSCDGVDAASLQWFKISEASGEGTNWGTDQLIRDRSWTFTIPENVKTGAYLVRHELIAMRMPGQPQVYPVCIQTNVVSSSGNGVPSETVTFPDAYQDFEQDFREIDIFKQGEFQFPFIPPGPRPATLGDGGSGSGAGSSSTSALSSGADGGAVGSSSASAPTPSSGGIGNGDSNSEGQISDQAPAPSAEGSAPPQESGSGGQADPSVTQPPATTAPANSAAQVSGSSSRGGRGGGRGRGSSVAHKSSCRQGADEQRRSRGPNRGTGSVSSTGSV